MPYSYIHAKKTEIFHLQSIAESSLIFAACTRGSLKNVLGAGTSQFPPRPFFFHEYWLFRNNR